MGNNTSTEEKVGGGLLTGMGIILAFTPVGPFTSTWMLPVGGGLLAGKEVKSGAGVTYADDGKCAQFHVGDPNNFIRQREHVVNNEAIQKAKLLEQKRNDEIRFNNSIKNFVTNYTMCFDQFKRKSDLYFYYPKIKVFSFSSHQHAHDNNKFNNYANDMYSKIGKTYCSNDDEQIDKIYVIRRNLGKFSFNIGWLAHSGLLLKTKQNNYYICEYGVEKNKNAVSCYKINVTISDAMPSCSNFISGTNKWDKQTSGSQVNNISVGQVHTTMMELAWKQKYSMLFWNCHMIQEKTREELGIPVNIKYFSDELKQEMELYNGLL